MSRCDHYSKHLRALRDILSGIEHTEEVPSSVELEIEEHAEALMQLVGYECLDKSAALLR